MSDYAKACRAFCEALAEKELRGLFSGLTAKAREKAVLAMTADVTEALILAQTAWLDERAAYSLVNNYVYGGEEEAEPRTGAGDDFDNIPDGIPNPGPIMEDMAQGYCMVPADLSEDIFFAEEILTSGAPDFAVIEGEGEVYE